MKNKEKEKKEKVKKKCAHQQLGVDGRETQVFFLTATIC